MCVVQSLLCTVCVLMDIQAMNTIDSCVSSLGYCVIILPSIIHKLLTTCIIMVQGGLGSIRDTSYCWSLSCKGQMHQILIWCIHLYCFLSLCSTNHATILDSKTQCGYSVVSPGQTIFFTNQMKEENYSLRLQCGCTYSETLQKGHTLNTKSQYLPYYVYMKSLYYSWAPWCLK